jgi:Type II secretion system (T2SS), protein F
MNAPRSTAVPWLVGMAWGALGAAPLVMRARRRGINTRLESLRAVPRGESRTRAIAALLGRVRAHVPSGPVARVLAGWRGHRQARRDDAAIAAELPVTLDLLGVAVEAGCTPYLAVDLAQRWTPPAMAARLTEVRDACALGASFGDALGDLGRRVPRLRALADALRASDRLGAPVGPALSRLADEQRAELRRRAEAHARRVPVRLLFPLVFVVLPAFGLLTVIPTLLAGFARM